MADKPALLTDNGPGYISNVVEEFLRTHGLRLCLDYYQESAEQRPALGMSDQNAC